jgi:hypothetical protein
VAARENEFDARVSETAERDLSAEITLDLENKPPWWVTSGKGSGPKADPGQTERVEGTTGSDCGCFTEFVKAQEAATSLARDTEQPAKDGESGYS